jgi:hypothetical protein
MVPLCVPEMLGYGFAEPLVSKIYSEGITVIELLTVKVACR